MSPRSIVFLHYVADLKKWLPTARLRPHVVLKLLFELVDSKYPLQRAERNILRLKEELRTRLGQMYPEEESHLPEEEREGRIPPVVMKAIAEALSDLPHSSKSGIPQKHATPADPPDNLDVILETLRPSLVTGDRDSESIISKDSRETLALRELVHRQRALISATTNVRLVDQWNWNFLQLAFPYSIPRVVGGADFPQQKRIRRQSDAAVLAPWDYLGMHARRVESNLKNDWFGVQSMEVLMSRLNVLQTFIV